MTKTEKKAAATTVGTDVYRAVQACMTRLATDFDTPAKMILGEFGPKIGMSGDELGHILWELAGAQS